LVAGCGVVVASAYVVAAHRDPASLDALTHPLSTPNVPVLLVAAALVAVLPAWLTPPVPRATARRTTTRPTPRQPVGATS
jgi:energy-coupling factor transport system permease protein